MLAQSLICLKQNESRSKSEVSFQREPLKCKLKQNTDVHHQQFKAEPH